VKIVVNFPENRPCKERSVKGSLHAESSRGELENREMNKPENIDNGQKIEWYLNNVREGELYYLEWDW
jgi:hypothetical protein